MNMIYLKKLIKKHETKNKFLISLAFTTISNKQKNIFLYNSHVRRPAASLTKLFVLGAIAEAISSGQYDIQRSITITDYVTGSGILKYIPTPITLTLQQLVYLTAVYSDNSATNAILSLITIQKVNDFIKKIRANDTKIVVPMMPPPNTETAQEYNYTTVDDVVLFYRYIFNEPPTAMHWQTASLCRKFLSPSRGSLINILLFLLSATNVQYVVKILLHNPFALTKYIHAALSPLRHKRLAAHMRNQQVIAKKSATGQHIFHDSCVIKKRNDLFCVVSMIECPAANFYQKKSVEYKAAFGLTRLIGKTLYKK